MSEKIEPMTPEEETEFLKRFVDLIRGKYPDERERCLAIVETWLEDQEHRGQTLAEALAGVARAIRGE